MKKILMILLVSVIFSLFGCVGEGMLKETSDLIYVNYAKRIVVRNLTEEGKKKNQSIFRPSLEKSPLLILVKKHLIIFIF